MNFTYSQTAARLGYLRSDGLYVPIDPNNGDYVAFLAWETAGNTPTAYQPPAPNPVSTIAASTRSRALTQAKQKAAQGDTAGALALLIQHIEGSQS